MSTPAVPIESPTLFADEKPPTLAKRRRRQFVGKQLKDRRQRVETAPIAELARHLQIAREDERGRLARALHDELGALLTAAKLDVARIKKRVVAWPPETLERLTHLNETLNSVIGLSRSIIEDLRPSTLDNLGLVPALEILARDFQSRNGIRVDCILHATSLSPQSQLTVFRLVQEALTNITKYASAGSVQLSMTRDGCGAIVCVEDDGVGFDLSERRAGSYGLLGMRHRIEGDGGCLSIASTPGIGTRVCATLPLQSHDGLE